VYIGAYAIDDDPSIFRLVIASIVDIESFNKQCTQLDSATRVYLATRLDYYQVYAHISRPYRAHSSLIVVDNHCNIKITNTTCSNYYHGFIWDASIHKYTVTVNISNHMYFHVGFAPSIVFDVSKSNYASCGWYLYLCNGTLYSQNGDKGKAYSSRCEVGDTMACIYNASSSEISFEKNGVSLGVAFTNVNGEDIAPAVELGNTGDGITLSSSVN
jgi:SPRY domain